MTMLVCHADRPSPPQQGPRVSALLLELTTLVLSGPRRSRPHGAIASFQLTLPIPPIHLHPPSSSSRSPAGIRSSGCTCAFVRMQCTSRSTSLCLGTEHVQLCYHEALPNPERCRGEAGLDPLSPLSLCICWASGCILLVRFDVNLLPTASVPRV